MKLKANPQRPRVFVTPEGRVFIEAAMSTVAHGHHLVHALNENGRPVAVRRHTLVAETYHGPKPAGKQVRPLDNEGILEGGPRDMETQTRFAGPPAFAAA
jgi:hypothetical protein